MAGIRGINQPVNVAVSNVPGSPTPLYLGGARQRAQYPISGVLDGIGLNITVFSYQDSLEFGIVVDRDSSMTRGPCSPPCGSVWTSLLTWLKTTPP